MGLKLKTGRAINDPYNGELTTAYVNVKFQGGWNAKQEEPVRFDFFCYRTEENKDSKPIMQENIIIAWGDYKQFIDKEITADDLHEGDTPDRIKIRNLYNYVVTLEQDVSEKQDGSDMQPITFFGRPVTDWESDEI